MPALGPQQDGRAGRPEQLLLDQPRRLVEHQLVGLAPALVVLLEALHAGARLVGIARQEQPHALLRVAHPAGRVDARRQHEGHVAAVDLAPAEPGDVNQCPQAQTRRACDARQPRSRQDPVVTYEWNDIRDRADVEIVDGLTNAAPAQQRLHQLVRHAHRRQLLERIGAAGLTRVDHGTCRRQERRRLVMIGDHGVDAELERAVHCLDRGDAAVDRDDQTNAPGMRLLDRLDRQPVAVLGAVRDAVFHARAQLAQRGVEQVGRGDAVDVVVAEDERRFPVARGTLDTIDGRAEVLE